MPVVQSVSTAMTAQAKLIKAFTCPSSDPTTVLVENAPALKCHNACACLQRQHSQYMHAGPHGANLQRQSVTLWHVNKGNDRFLSYACLGTGLEALVTWRKSFGGRDDVQSIWPEQLLGSWKRKKLKRPRWSFHLLIANHRA